MPSSAPRPKSPVAIPLPPFMTPNSRGTVKVSRAMFLKNMGIARRRASSSLMPFCIMSLTTAPYSDRESAKFDVGIERTVSAMRACPAFDMARRPNPARDKADVKARVPPATAAPGMRADSAMIGTVEPIPEPTSVANLFGFRK